ncbi:MAG: phosphoribosyltransferase family protein [Candidatus Omnitrophica bacterium]|nr:phosphoribosyltransferase family protein [Candidatus Omnitrophota bacterium]
MTKNLRIISRSSEPFKNRVEAGKLLAKELRQKANSGTVVLGVPRGGVVVAGEIAGILSLEMDIVLSRKIGAPFNPEYAIGAVSEDGKAFINPEALREVNSEDEYVKKEKELQTTEIKRRSELYRRIKPKVIIKDRTVIICDDGVATGTTMQAAIWALRQESCGKIILALPVAPYETIIRLSKEADETIVLRVPEFFAAVGQFYLDFPQIEDSEVIEILKRYGK